MVSISWFMFVWFILGVVSVVVAAIILGKNRIPSFIIILLMWAGIIVMIESYSMAFKKIDYLGAPIMFNDLQKNSAYKIVKVIDGTYALIQYKDNEPKLIKNIPKELADMGEGATFEIKDIPSVTSGEKFVVPILHPH